jgi:hypothetical protein
MTARPWTPSPRLAWGLSLAQTGVWLPLSVAGALSSVSSSSGALLTNLKDVLFWLGLWCLYGGLGAVGGLTGLVLAARSIKARKEAAAEDRLLRYSFRANLIGGGLQLGVWFVILVMISTIPGGMHGRPSWR